MLLAVSYGLDVGAEIVAVFTAADTDMLVLDEEARIIFLGSYLVIVLIFTGYQF